MLVFFLTQWLCFYGPAPSVAGALVVAGEERRLWATVGARGLSLLSAHLCGLFCSQLRCICVLAAVACVVWVSCVWVSCKCWVLIPSFFLIQWDTDLPRFSRKRKGEIAYCIDGKCITWFQDGEFHLWGYGLALPYVLCLAPRVIWGWAPSWVEMVKWQKGPDRYIH